MQRLDTTERNELLSRVAQLWERWELHALKSLLSDLPEDQLFEEPELAHRLVTVFVQLQDADPAEELSRRLLEHVRQTGNDRIYRRAVNTEGTRLMTNGQLEEAEKELIHALELANRVADFIGVAAASTNLGTVASIRREWDEAIVAYTRALIAGQRIGNAQMIAGAFQNLALTYREMGFLRTAEAHLDQAIEILRSIGSLRLVQSEVERALLQHAMGESSLAEATARRMLKETRTHKLPRDEGECLRILGIILAADREDEAVACFREAIPLAQQVRNLLLEAEVLEEWAALEHRRANREGAADLAARSKAIYLAMGAERRAERVDERMA